MAFGTIKGAMTKHMPQEFYDRIKPQRCTCESPKAGRYIGNSDAYECEKCKKAVSGLELFLKRTKKKITYRQHRGKWVFCKDGVYFSLTFEQVHEMNEIIDDIIRTQIHARLLEKEDIDANAGIRP